MSALETEGVRRGQERAREVRRGFLRGQRHHAVQAWPDDSSRDLDEHLDETFADLRGLTAKAGG
ncbi:hypothetical protein ACIOD2_33140 [Amycolatopsis sp. NPDC088138]|uniref:hypothetical protein n=1 Tax=Amycolatopsis sp. NPDC088138 TaxID=3363938 RepID=UPI0038210B45